MRRCWYPEDGKVRLCGRLEIRIDEITVVGRGSRHKKLFIASICFTSTVEVKSYLGPSSSISKTL
jgi:hypothetical protein